MDKEKIGQRDFQITNVIPITMQAARGYPAWVIVQIQTDVGIEGIGEGFTWSGQAESIADYIKSLGEKILGSRITDIQTFRDRFPTKEENRNWSAAVSAVEIALWDILGKVTSRPIYQLLGGKVRDKIPLYADHGIFSGARDWEECIDRILKAKDNGFTMFKWDPFTGGGTPTSCSLKDQIKKIEMVRSAVGSEYQIAIDAHNRFSVKGAIMAAKAMESYDILFFEAPTVDDTRLLKEVADATHIPLATGELTCTIEQSKDLFESGSLGLFQPEVGTNGGILATIAMADLASQYHLKIATHNWCGPVITRAASHACAVIPNLLFQEYAGGAAIDSWENELLIPETKIENGHLILPDLPGLGFELNKDLLDQKRIS